MAGLMAVASVLWTYQAESFAAEIPEQAENPEQGSTSTQTQNTILTLPADSTNGAEVSEGKDLEKLFWTRRSEQKGSFDEADVTFMTMMIPHHAQALVMSEMAEKNEAGPAVRTLASRIMNAQGDEIATMQRWLEIRKQPVPRILMDGIVMTIEVEMPDENEDKKDHEGMDHEGRDHSEMAHSHHDMPGMLSQEEVEHLASLRGEEFDRWYLTYMIGHHQGAVIMVDELFASEKGGRDEESFRLASDIYTEQTTEIDRMKFMLRQMDQ